MNQADLSKEAWRIIGQLIETGRTTLLDGTEVTPNSKTLVELFKWVAGLKKETSREVPLPEDFHGGAQGAPGGADAKP